MGNHRPSQIKAWADYPSIKEMTDRILNQKAGSKATCLAYTWGVRWFARFLGYSEPESLLADFKKEKLDLGQSLDNFISAQERSVGPKSLIVRICGVKRWASSNGLDVSVLRSVGMPKIVIGKYEHVLNRKKLIDILKTRLAKGDIGIEEYREAKAELLSKKTRIELQTTFGCTFLRIASAAYPCPSVSL